MNSRERGFNTVSLWGTADQSSSESHLSCYSLQQNLTGSSKAAAHWDLPWETWCSAPLQPLRLGYHPCDSTDMSCRSPHGLQGATRNHIINREAPWGLKSCSLVSIPVPTDLELPHIIISCASENPTLQGDPMLSPLPRNTHEERWGYHRAVTKQNKGIPEGSGRAWADLIHIQTAQEAGGRGVSLDLCIGSWNTQSSF